MKYTRPVNEQDYAKYGTTAGQKPDTTSISARKSERRLKIVRSRGGAATPVPHRYPPSRRIHPWHLSVRSKYKPHQGSQECARRVSR